MHLTIYKCFARRKILVQIFPTLFIALLFSLSYNFHTQILVTKVETVKKLNFYQKEILTFKLV